MRIVIKGFKDQTVVTIKELTDMIETIPLHHKQKIRNIVYDPTRFFQRSYVNPRPINTRVAAEYNTMPWAFVVVYRFDSKAQLRHMLYHEIGHHVYNYVLSSTQKKHWVTQIYPEKKFISQYASTNASEDFAETYSFFFHSPAKCRQFPHKYEFIKSI